MTLGAGVVGGPGLLVVSPGAKWSTVRGQMSDTTGLMNQCDLAWDAVSLPACEASGLLVVCVYVSFVSLSVFPLFAHNTRSW